MKNKKIEIEFRDNSDLTIEQREDRMKILAFDAITILSQKYEAENYRRLLTVIAEMSDLIQIEEQLKIGGENENK